MKHDPRPESNESHTCGNSDLQVYFFSVTGCVLKESVGVLIYFSPLLLASLM